MPLCVSASPSFQWRHPGDPTVAFGPLARKQEAWPSSSSTLTKTTPKDAKMKQTITIIILMWHKAISTTRTQS